MNVLIFYVNSKRQVELFCVTFLVESLFLEFYNKIKLNIILDLSHKPISLSFTVFLRY